MTSYPTRLLGVDARERARVWIATGFLALLSHPASAVPQILDLAGMARAGGVSADGSTVVGRSASGSDQAAWWTQAQGVQEIGHLPGASSSTATAITPDGSAIVGISSPTVGSPQGFRWTAATGMVPLGFGPDPHALPVSQAFAITDDGGTVSGVSRTASSGYTGFLWTPAGGMDYVTALAGWPAGASDGGGVATVSADGSTVVASPSAGAARWTASGGFELLAPPPGFTGTSTVSVLSADGTSAGGILDGGDRVFRWTGATGMVDLGAVADLSGVGTAADHSVEGISGDGGRMVGTAWTTLGPFGTVREAFVWDAQGGLRTLRSMLENEYGLDVSEWRFDAAAGISRDGRVIVGNGRRNGIATAFLVNVPEPPVGLLLPAGVVALGLLIHPRRRRRAPGAAGGTAAWRWGGRRARPAGTRCRHPRSGSP